MSDFWTFRWMLTPVLIQVMFVLGSLVAIAVGLVAIGAGASDHDGGKLVGGIFLVLLGPVFIRLYSELLIVVFRINDSLTDIRALAVWTAEREHQFDAGSLDEDDDET